jgi:hypothetical protein
MQFCLPETEWHIISYYLDAVSHSLARRFARGSPPNEENLTFLLCELLDEGSSSDHLLEYPLSKAKEDLAKADGGITIDVKFQTHEHTKYVEHKYSGADLGVIFAIEHPHLGRSERAVLLQAKRLFQARNTYSLNSSFGGFDLQQFTLLKTLQRRFGAYNSIFYLWYCPSSTAFGDQDAKVLRALEAFQDGAPEVIYYRGRWTDELEYIVQRNQHILDCAPKRQTIEPETAQRLRAWREAQPATRFSELDVVEHLTKSGKGLSIRSLYQMRMGRTRRRLRDVSAFEPFKKLFLLGLQTDEVGHSSDEWLRLARGEKVALPAAASAPSSRDDGPEMPDLFPAPRHTLTITLRSELEWPDGWREER